ncbi:acetylornithine aminotransferase [Oceanospirillum sp. MED92]|uniref:Acetylornithine aminotransferase n=1 Tax=Neptuniibacter caesariensis TaxID=207954 RepID=A0A7U8C5F5_NEPCE|nr:acetylornithine aminotransferase [Oceanospirillum sp. MED92] [Neptuniibacter caesariensis]
MTDSEAELLVNTLSQIIRVYAADERGEETNDHSEERRAK